MKKISNYKSFLVILALSLASVSCEPDNESGDNKNIKPIVTADQTNFALVEGETATITLTSNTAINLSQTFKLEIVGGDATFRDYTSSGSETSEGEGFGPIGHIVTIPAYATTATFDLTPVLDLLTEGTETLKLRMYSDSYARGLVDSGSEFITISIADVVSNDIGVELDWSQGFADSFGTLQTATYLGADGKQYDYSDYDFDLYIFDAAFNEVSGFAGATAAVPETATLLGADLADGVYEIYADKYTNAIATHAPAGLLQIPVTLNISKFGTWSKTIEVDYFTSATPVSTPNGLAGGEFLVATFTKAGSIYTLNDPTTNEVLAQGRLAQARKAIKNLKKNKI